jgi:hypothetical protein
VYLDALRECEMVAALDGVLRWAACSRAQCDAVWARYLALVQYGCGVMGGGLGLEGAWEALSAAVQAGERQAVMAALRDVWGMPAS